MKKSRNNGRRGNGRRKTPKSFVKAFGRKLAASAIGTGATLGAISSAGIGGFSAAGITSGLAALGLGSMLGGVLVAPALGYGAYHASNWIFTPAQEREAE